MAKNKKSLRKKSGMRKQVARSHNVTPKPALRNDKSSLSKGLLISGLLLTLFLTTFFVLKSKNLDNIVGDKNDKNNTNLVSPLPRANESTDPDEETDIDKRTVSSDSSTKIDEIKVGQSKIVDKLPHTSSSSVNYEVRKGDNLAKLGKLFCQDKRAWIHLAELNQISEPYILTVGDQVTINCNN